MERIDFQKLGGVVEIYAPSRTPLQCRISLFLICFALHLFFQPITLPLTLTARTECSLFFFFLVEIITFAKCSFFFPLISSWFIFAHVLCSPGL